MAEVGTAFVALKPDTKGFGSATQKQISGEMGSSGKSLGSKFGTAFKFSAVAVLGGAALLGGFLKGAFEEAEEAQKVGALTNAVIKSTGGVANVTAKEVDDLSTALSEKIGVDDEAIAAGQNMLLTFGNVRNEVGKGNDIFTQATISVNDMAAAFGGDAVSNSKLLGKALNDPIKGVSALTRVGVSFTEQQKEQIETLIESGDVLGAQKIILGEVTKQTEGAAESQATAADRMRVAWGNLKESVGEALMPVLERLMNYIVDTVIPQLREWWDALAPAREAIARFAGGIAEIVGLIQDRNWGAVWQKFKDAAKDAWDWVVQEAKEFVPRLIGKILAGLGRLKERWTKWWHDFFNPPDRAYNKVEGRTDLWGERMIAKHGMISVRVLAVLGNNLGKMPGLALRIASSTVLSLIDALAAMPAKAGRIAASTVALLGRNLASMPGEAGRVAVYVVAAFGQGISAMPGIAQAIAVEAGLRLTGALRAIATSAYNAGAQIIDSLIAGITSRLAALGSKMAEVANKVRGFLPGSPVKEGPLTSWNNGGAGKALVDLLADGLSQTGPVDAAMRNLLSGANRRYAGGSLGVAGAAAGAGGGSGNINMYGPITTVDPKAAAREFMREQRKARVLAGMNL